MAKFTDILHPGVTVSDPVRARGAFSGAAVAVALAMSVAAATLPAGANADHGPGIPAGDRQRVFEPIVQLDQSSTRRQGGTGLGLHLCNQLAELLNGRLDLAETPGGRCRFTLVIPDLAEPPAPSTAPQLAAPAPVTVMEGALR